VAVSVDVAGGLPTQEASSDCGSAALTGDPAARRSTPVAARIRPEREPSASRPPSWWSESTAVALAGQRQLSLRLALQASRRREVARTRRAGPARAVRPRTPPADPTERVSRRAAARGALIRIARRPTQQRSRRAGAVVLRERGSHGALSARGAEALGSGPTPTQRKRHGPAGPCWSSHQRVAILWVGCPLCPTEQVSGGDRFQGGLPFPDESVFSSVSPRSMARSSLREATPSFTKIRRR